MKNSNDIIENRTHYLPACGSVPQPTAPPRTPVWNLALKINPCLLQHILVPTFLSSLANASKFFLCKL